MISFFFIKNSFLQKFLFIFLFIIGIFILFNLLSVNLFAQNVYFYSNFYEINLNSNFFYLKCFFYFNNLNNFVNFKNSYFLETIKSFNLFDSIKFKVESDNESKLRRAEILFFISIPFIYLYFRELMRLNNFLIYGDFDREWDNNQKMLMYITFLIFGFDVVYNDFKKNK